MNKTIMAEDKLFNFLDSAVPCKSCGEKPRIDVIGGLASSIGCRSERNLRYYQINKCIFSNEITTQDMVESVTNIIILWNKYNSIQEEK